MIRSDEESCGGTTQCHAGYFRCANDSWCIHTRFLCDGRQDCPDGADEKGCDTAACEPDQFRCNSGTCIPASLRCDGEPDCPDDSDEPGDCAYARCASHQFRCDDGLCIDEDLRCNGVDECGDSSDEADCRAPGPRSSCSGSHQFQCFTNASLCLPLGARCNGTSECPQHEDEKDCDRCLLNEFECANKRCIPVDFLCDNGDDCLDGSDESPKMCPHKTATHTGRVCADKFRCGNGDCVDRSKLCDGKADCGDFSDEDRACATSCLGSNNPCSHVCVKTPFGPNCSCPSGFQLQSDGRTCVDVSECAIEPPVCSQICIELPGTYRCDCYDGYMLRPDRKSCKGVGEPMSLIFGMDGDILHLTRSSNSLSR